MAWSGFRRERTSFEFRGQEQAFELGGGGALTAMDVYMGDVLEEPAEEGLVIDASLVTRLEPKEGDAHRHTREKRGARGACRSPQPRQGWDRGSRASLLPCPSLFPGRVKKQTGGGAWNEAP